MITIDLITRGGIDHRTPIRCCQIVTRCDCFVQFPRNKLRGTVKIIGFGDNHIHISGRAVPVLPVRQMPDKVTGVEQL